ncbi:MAG: ABC-2 family transporter protein, partial [bacterium]
MTPRLFLRIVSMQVRKLMSYRMDFWINAVASFFVQLGVIYFLWQAIFRQTGRPSIGGYTFNGMIVYYLMVILLGKFVRGADNESQMSREIYDGSLTRYLVYPTRYFIFKFGERLGDLAPALMQLVLFGSFLPLFLRNSEIEISFQSVSMMVVTLAIA